MEEIIAVVFDRELKAIEGFRILRELDHNNEISLYEAQVISKGSGGAVRAVEDADRLYLPLVGGSVVLGGLIGLLGGPLGVIGGASVGGIIGSAGDLKEEGVTEDFVHDVKLALAPDTAAIVADLEEWVTGAVDTRMKKLGGVVLRRARDVVEKSQEEIDAAEHRAEMERLKAEQAQVRGEDRAKIDARIGHLRAKLESVIERKRIKMQLRRQEREAKIRALEAQARQTQGEIRRRQEARIAELRQRYAAKTNAG